MRKTSSELHDEAAAPAIISRASQRLGSQPGCWILGYGVKIDLPDTLYDAAAEGAAGRGASENCSSTMPPFRSTNPTANINIAVTPYTCRRSRQVLEPR